ncbi:hypothetical protein COU60_01335 [Candidatus Pacearchaeota archaeon CG10_big_fil_rev_8_21_14_0_10_34_76]|nr:MAG: hypothetical protein COU60_01335 [Candidatus Pacearchaeota archaeon CG10_big_fil_rev_8_21_14_0_10_34_76]
MTDSEKGLKEMGVEIRAPNQRMPLLLYPDKRTLCETHLRPQEHYESPKFRGKIFTLTEFVPWYKQDRNTDEFTYYSDWNGFNVPSKSFEAFFDGRFDPLSDKEQALINFAKNLPRPFYLIATHKPHPGAAGVVRHELAHALWATNPGYMQEAERLVKSSDPRGLIDHLRSVGYDDSVIWDEVHAQSIKCRPDAIELIPDGLHEDMLATFLRFFPKRDLDVYLDGLNEEDK